MKSFKYILIACFSLMVATTSCKKEKTPEPAPTAQTTTPTTYGTFHIDIALVDMTAASYGCTSSWGSTRTAYIVCNGNRIDSLVGLSVSTYTTTSSPGVATLAASSTPKDFKVQDGADNYLEIYSDGVKVASSQIDRGNNKLWPDNLGGCPTYPSNYGNYAGGYPVLCTPIW